MDLYQEKLQLRYHSVDEADAIWKKSESKKAEEIARNLIKMGLSIEEIAGSTELPIDKIKKMAKKHTKGK